MSEDVKKIIFGALLVFGIIFLYVQEVGILQNTLNFKKLVTSALMTGGILGAFLGFQLGKNRKELLERVQLFIGVLILTLMIMPLIISIANRKLTFKAPRVEKLEFLRIETFAGSRFGNLVELKEKPDGFRVYLLRNAEVIRLQKKEPPFQDKTKGDKVDLPIYRGLFGIEYVDWK